MSVLVQDENRNDVQAFRLPKAGATTAIAITVGGTSGVSGALQAGVYRIVSDADVTLALGSTASAADMPMRANQPEYFYVNQGASVAAFAAIAPANVYLTRMP